MSSSTGHLNIDERLSAIDPRVAISLPFITAPFGSIFGGLFTSHLVGSMIDGVWITTAVFTSLAFLVISLRS